MILERLLQSQGFGSRKACRALIQQGRVRVAGYCCTAPNAEFLPPLKFSIDDETWTYHAQIYLILYKPPGYECSHTPQHHASVYSLLPDPFRARGVVSVGRLDQDTTGLLLFSDDGAFVHAHTSPKKQVPKVYEVSTRHPLDEHQLTALLNGVQLHDEPSPLTAYGCRQTGTHTLRLALTQGKYHQVKRMLAAVGNRVEALHRAAIGSLVLGDLAVGQWRYLDAADLAALQASPEI